MHWLKWFISASVPVTDTGFMGLALLFLSNFSQVFWEKNPVIKLVMCLRLAGFWQIQISRKVFNLRSSNFTHGFFRVSAFM